MNRCAQFALPMGDRPGLRFADGINAVSRFSGGRRFTYIYYISKIYIQYYFPLIEDLHFRVWKSMFELYLDLN